MTDVIEIPIKPLMMDSIAIPRVRAQSVDVEAMRRRIQPNYLDPDALTRPRTYSIDSPRRVNKGHVIVLIVGDAGRAIRMQYHALSLAEQKFKVSLVGLAGTPLIKELQPFIHNEMVKVLRYSIPFTKQVGKTWYFLTIPFKLFFQALFLILTLFLIAGRPTHILVQTPPAVPALPIAWLAARRHRSRLVIDWHNFGYTMLGLRFGMSHPLVLVYAVIEKYFGRKADACFAVSRHMAERIRAKFGVSDSIVVYDKPGSVFYRRDNALAHSLFHRLGLLVEENHTRLIYRSPTDKDISRPSLFTLADASNTRVGPMLLMSSTTWTADEDNIALIDGLAKLDKKLIEAGTKPGLKLVCVITGNGPMLHEGVARIKEHRLKHVRIHTAWLTNEDYALLAGVSDVSINLHTSSSGVDLPITVQDMFGSGLPVISVDYPTIHEVLKPEYGIVMGKGPIADEVCSTMFELLKEGRGTGSRLYTMRQSIVKRFGDQHNKDRSDRWDRNWRMTAFSAFRTSGTRKTD
ncbi:Glycosyl transferase 4-like domain [Carpediemonas membranifera]|uniref:Glycosyl transferase 4-like domain n=1 Tax=Carpediemonas membranifera TaxID=201153 RepID=A0A8J6AWW7_9EUKA|nr:Glycosyl transferase 4-like domain [Carpediemonas membranifera]|eukprot:KAG9393585.1 Glycosyl transferase 4-like domain [Carpediemonas membranifera]